MAVNLQERLRQEYTAALKARNEHTVAALRLLITQLKNAAIAKQHALSDEETLEVVRREVKKHRESVEAYEAAGRAERVAQEQAELSVLLAYLPKQLDAAALDAVIQDALAAEPAATSSDFGRLMKQVMERVRGQADGRMVSDALRAALQKRT